jgi:hypothetical protein
VFIYKLLKFISVIALLLTTVILLFKLNKTRK